MENTNLLDVTVIEPRLKHPTIFNKFDALLSSESFIISNDHDPKPLYYQLLAERGKIFSWEYLEEGPEVWKVKIGKLSTENGEVTIGEIVAKDFRKAEVFKKFGLDFCCGGNKTVSQVCQEKGIDLATVERELNDVSTKSGGQTLHFDNWDLSFIVDYITNTHHKYVQQSIPVIYEYAQKVANRHGESHPEVIAITNLFVEIANELGEHMKKEETILFPYIKNLDEASKNKLPLQPPPFRTIKNPIQMMESEHQSAGNGFEEIKALSNGYTAPEDACTTFRLFYAKLQEFEEDLHTHVHLENNILFLKAIKLENEVLFS